MRLLGLVPQVDYLEQILDDHRALQQMRRFLTGRLNEAQFTSPYASVYRSRLRWEMEEAKRG